jgi:hypothetical protein
MHLRSTPVKKVECSTVFVEPIHAFVMNGDGNPIVKARCAAVGGGFGLVARKRHS